MWFAWMGLGRHFPSRSCGDDGVRGACLGAGVRTERTRSETEGCERPNKNAVSSDPCKFAPGWGSAASTGAAVVDVAERRYRAVEFGALFVVMPALLALRTVHIPFIVLLYSAFALCLTLLLRDRTFDRSCLWSPARVRIGLTRMVVLFGAAAFFLAAVVWVLLPDQFLAFPRERPVIWAAVMLLYPVISVWPQNVIYRSFVFHRYQCLFPTSNAMLWASALSFAWGHVIFQNWVALALTLPGGLIFAATYMRTRSAFASSLEHAMYGCMVFTIGLGQSLYYAAVQSGR